MSRKAAETSQVAGAVKAGGRAPRWRYCEGVSHRGQVIVEVLLILPVFLWLVFLIMEIGYLAYRTIALHHAAYELARIGSLTAKPDTAPKSCASPNVDPTPMNNALGKMMSLSGGVLNNAKLTFIGPPDPRVATLTDPQEGCANYDIEVTLSVPMQLVFPMTNVILSNPRGGNSRLVSATVRMPVERPLFK